MEACNKINHRTLACRDKIFKDISEEGCVLRERALTLQDEFRHECVKRSLIICFELQYHVRDTLVSNPYQENRIRCDHIEISMSGSTLDSTATKNQVE